MIKPFFEVENKIVNRDILEVPFCCDLDKCKGACCTIESDYGAPLLPEEIALMEKSLPQALQYLPEEHRADIQANGFYEEKEGELVTRSINNRACVLVYFENGVAKCALEKAYFEKKVKFRKPISCHLFPIRISNVFGEVLRYEQFSECTHALKKGKEVNITVAEFCKDSLERKYNKRWYSKLIKLIQK